VRCEVTPTILCCVSLSVHDYYFIIARHNRKQSAQTLRYIGLAPLSTCYLLHLFFLWTEGLVQSHVNARGEYQWANPTQPPPHVPSRSTVDYFPCLTALASSTPDFHLCTHSLTHSLIFARKSDVLSHCSSLIAHRSLSTTYTRPIYMKQLALHRHQRRPRSWPNPGRVLRS
jgi:hypothetical protein